MSAPLSAPPGELEVEIEKSVSLQTGETLHLDFRPAALQTSIYAPTATIRALKTVQWNIERGIKLDNIIEDLQSIDADIIALQEVDSGLSRSEYLDTGIAIARTLGLNYVFQCEFIELEGDIDKKYYFQHHASQPPTSPLFTRTDPTYQASYKRHHTHISTTAPIFNHDKKPHNPLMQFHPTPVATASTTKYPRYAVQSEKTGVHGNAVLTKFDISSILPLLHKHHPYNWDKDGVLLNEPRVGSRATLCVVIDVPERFTLNQLHSPQPNTQLYTPKDSGQSRVHVPVYTCHMELFCGIIDRLKIFSEILQHFRTNFLPHPDSFCNAMILGDFNTLAHSIARFSPKYCKDVLRWRNLGYTEAEWWYKYVFDSYNSNSIPPGSNLQQLNLPGLTLQDYRALVNPGFEESFPANTETLTNYSGWFYGKLDWMLTMNCLLTNHDLFNLDYLSSDHRGMIIQYFLKTKPTEQSNLVEFKPTLELPQIASKISHVLTNTSLIAIPTSQLKNKADFPVSSTNQQFTFVPTLRNQIDGFANHHSGIRGYVSRNLTPFVTQLIAFGLPTLIALLYLFFFAPSRS